MAERLPGLSESSEPPKEMQHAPSWDDPQVDLLTPSSIYTCHSCQVPLATFTRVVAREVSAPQQGFRSFCLGCFTGWSKSNRTLPCDGKEYQYMVVEAGGGEWSSIETITLFECVQQFGMSCWENVQREFNWRTGGQRKEMELAHRYLRFYQGNDPDFNFRSIYGPKAIVDAPQGRPKKPRNCFDRNNPDELMSLRFDRMLQVNDILSFTHYPQEDHHAYLLTLLAERTSRNGGQEDPPAQEGAFAAKWMRESIHFIQEETNALDALRRLFVTAHNRQTRQGRRLLGVSQDSPHFIGDDVDDYLQTTALNAIAGMPQLIQALWDVRQKREQLRTRQRKEKTSRAKGKKRVTFAPKRKPPKKQPVKAKAKASRAGRNSRRK